MIQVRGSVLHHPNSRDLNMIFAGTIQRQSLDLSSLLAPMISSFPLPHSSLSGIHSPDFHGTKGTRGDSREENMEKGEGEQEVDNSMLLCTQGVMATNAFFAARELEIRPTSSGGSPMASAPPAAESGGRRSFCSPSPATAAGECD